MIRNQSGNTTSGTEEMDQPRPAEEENMFNQTMRVEQNTPLVLTSQKLSFWWSTSAYHGVNIGLRRIEDIQVKRDLEPSSFHVHLFMMQLCFII